MKSKILEVIQGATVTFCSLAGAAASTFVGLIAYGGAMANRDEYVVACFFAVFAMVAFAVGLVFVTGLLSYIVNCFEERQ